MTIRQSAALGLALSIAGVAQAQTTATAQVDLSTVSNFTMVSDNRTPGAGVGIDNPIYRAGGFGAGSANASVVNLWFNRVGGGISGCTGTMLNARQILTAAHCVSNGTALTSTSFTARFRVGSGNTAADWIEVTGSGYAVRDGYTGVVIEERDVAVLTLSADAPAWAAGRGLADGPALVRSTIGGYGRYGVIGAGVSFSDQFTNSAIVRSGWQQFETTCRTGGSCSTNTGDFNNFGGVLLADADLSGTSAAGGFMCAALRFCNAGFSDFMEVGINRGDSGSAALDANGRIIGVASWGSISDPGSLIPVGGNIGYACVANVVGNAACQANFNWVQAQVVPEPSTYALMATGLAGLAAMARRRRRA
jgi:hypothetical protein